jgi:hypothetical protein
MGVGVGCHCSALSSAGAVGRDQSGAMINCGRADIWAFVREVTL